MSKGKTYRQQSHKLMMLSDSDSETEFNAELPHANENIVPDSQKPTSSLSNITSTPIRPAKRNSDGKKKEGKWSEDETLLFANIIVDEGYAIPLEMLALKKSSNEELFSHLKFEFDKQIKTLEYSKKYGPLDTSIVKLRKKYTNLKLEYTKITKRIKEGSGHAASTEPKWYAVLNDVFSERCADLNLCSKAGDTSYVNESTQNEHQDGEAEEDEDDDSTSLPATGESSNSDKGKLLVNNLCKRAKSARSQTQAIAELAKSIDRSTDVQMKRAEAAISAEKQRHDEYLSFKMSEAEKNRAHELELARIYASAMRPALPPPTPSYYPLSSALAAASNQSQQKYYPQQTYSRTGNTGYE